jgi:hypothetical protein
LRQKRPFPQSRLVTQTKQVPDPFGEPPCRSLHSRQRGAAADPDPLIRRALLDIRAFKSSILERNSLRIGEVFALL